MSAALYSTAPRESRRARERAQGAMSYEDYVSTQRVERAQQRSPGLTMVDDHPGSEPFPELPGAPPRQAWATAVHAPCAAALAPGSVVQTGPWLGGCLGASHVADAQPLAA